MNSNPINLPAVQSILDEHRATIDATMAMAPDILRFSEMVADCLRAGGTIFLCGNGGSAADAQHIAGEFVSRFLLERQALPAIALHTNTTVMTAIGNDYSFDVVYSRQIEAHGRPGDLLIAISTSGGSPNILKACEAAKERGMTVVGWTGSRVSPLPAMCDLCLAVPSTHTPRIQEMHILIGHIMCELVEKALAQ
ncbi:MAG: D-sedoheptulose 7-phosphate isomerase [Armatimonadetes bacterium]|nr:D-sedoheptulose 7-phosphate isomerase [Armatimonadota bacterium]